MDWAIILQLTINFLTNPLFLLTIFYSVCFVVLIRKKIAAEYVYVMQLLFFVTSFFIWILKFPYSNIDMAGYLMFASSLTLSIFFDLERKVIKIFTGFLAVSLLASSIIVIILYPILSETNPQSPITLLLFNMTIPTFHYYIFLTSVLSFLWGFCSIHLLDLAIQQILPRENPLMSLQKTVFIYYQVIPITLLPIILAQVFARTDLLERLSTTLFNLCSTYVLFILYAISRGILGNKILKTKYLWVSSIFTLISVTSTLYLAFQYVVWKVDYGSWIVGFILVPLISFVSGIITRRSCRVEK